MIQRTKDRLYRNLEQALPQEESGIVAAMILGEKTALDTEVKTLYQQMGISHILAISGLHISLLGAGLFYFLRRFVFPMKIAVWVTAVLLLFYGELTGFSVSATRAIGMMIILLFARFLGRPYDVFCSLALCGLGQLLIFPTQLFQCGFLLSYGTVFGISFFLIPLQKQLKKKRIAQFLLSYLGVQVITLPIVLYYYFEWNPYSILANLLILPLMSMLLFSGIVGAIVYGVSPVAGELLFGTVHFILRWISLLGEILTNLPGADIITGRPPVMAIVIYYSAVAGIWCWIVYRNEIRVAVFIVAAVVGLLLVRPGTNGMQITNLDVGQGDSTLIRIYGKNILIDGGSTTEKEVARYRMVPFLKYMGIKSLDAVVITHGDKDHISGIQEILQDRKHMNLTIEPGEFVYVIGSTGAGKSTFIKLLYREEKATTGKVEVVGQDVSKIKNSKVPYFRRNIGVVFQNFRLLPKKTVFENVAFALEVIDTPRVEIRRRVRATLELVGLEDKVNSFPHELSGGQQQRVAIARAIVNRPKVLIADEPTGNLDPETSKEIISLLERINEKQNTTVLVVTHDSKIVQEHKKRTILIEDGCVNADTSLGGYEI